MDKLVEECTESVEEVELAKISLVFKMKISKKTNAILEHCRSYYFQLPLQLTLELVLIFLDCHWYLIFITCVKFWYLYSNNNLIIWVGNIKEFNIKNRTYCFFNDMINIEYFDSSSLKIDKNSYKNITIYYIGYITIKKLMIMKIFIV